MIADPQSTSPQEFYKLLIGSIVPRPIAFVSSVNENGKHNLAPFSFFTVASANPPILCFCPAPREGHAKDTLRNVRATREFVVNIVTEAIAAQMNLTSGEYPPEVDEFALSGLTPVPSDIVAPPRVAESPINFECKLTQIVEVSPLPTAGMMVLGEVVRVHVRDELVDHFRIDPERLNAIGRMGGAGYSRTRDRFDMQRPKV